MKKKRKQSRNRLSISDKIALLGIAIDVIFKILDLILK